MDIYGINILAVVLATLGFMVVGFLWYGPLFGKRWMALHGYTEESMAGTNMTVVMAKGLTNSLVMAIGLAFMFNFLGVDSIMEAIHYSAMLWLFFSATTQLLAHIYEKQPFELTLINWGNQLVGMVLAGVIISLF
tara:strand:+ start:1786 stop:2190 length:405 start_codon:yes stop_codon:yes gene_type:complete